MRAQATWRKENAGLCSLCEEVDNQTSKFKVRLVKGWNLIIGRDYVCPPSSTLDHHTPTGPFPEVMPSFTRYTDTEKEIQIDETGNLRNRLGYGKDVGIVQPECKTFTTAKFWQLFYIPKLWLENRRPRNLVRAYSRKMLLKVKGIFMVFIVKMGFMNINSNVIKC